MSLHYCENCHQLEGDCTYDADSDETICDACGEPVKHVPEHDDFDMER